MARSISALNATLPLSSDCSSFISKPSIFRKTYKPKAIPINFNIIASQKPVATNSILNYKVPTSRNTKQIITNDPLAYTYTTPSYTAPTNGSYGRGRTPWEIKERETEYKTRFDVPGMSKEDVKVWVEEKNMLVVQAEKKPDQDEWPSVKYRWVIALPENIEFEKIKAEVKDGVLYITIPKSPLSAKILNIDVQ